MSSLKSSGCSNTRTNVYLYDSATKMTDGIVAGSTLDTANEIWWYQTAWDIIVDLGLEIILDYVRFNYDVWIPASVPAPPSVVVYGSHDSSSWDNLGTFNQSSNWLATDGDHWTNNLTVSGTYRYIKYSFATPGSGNVCAICETEIYGDSSTSINTILGIAKALVKSVNGLVIANVKTFNGLS